MEGAYFLKKESATPIYRHGGRFFALIKVLADSNKFVFIFIPKRFLETNENNYNKHSGRNYFNYSHLFLKRIVSRYWQFVSASSVRICWYRRNCSVALQMLIFLPVGLQIRQNEKELFQLYVYNSGNIN